MNAVLMCSAAVSTAMAAVPDPAPGQEPIEWRIEHIAGLKAKDDRAMLERLKQGVANKDRHTICSMIEYPLDARVQDAAACEQQFESLFDADVVRVITEQKFENLFANWRGVMIGRGVVWVSGVCRDKSCASPDLRIVAINGSMAKLTRQTHTRAVQPHNAPDGASRRR